MFCDQILRIRPCKFPVKLALEVFQLVGRFFLWPLANHYAEQMAGAVLPSNLWTYSHLYGASTPKNEGERKFVFFSENFIFLNCCNVGWN